MKRIILFVLLLSYSTSTNAGVRALGDESETLSNFSPTVRFDVSVPNAGQRCLEKGFTLTECAMNEFAADHCPFDDSYFKTCCSLQYRYSQDDCIQNNMVPSEESCGGFYACLEDSNTLTE